LQQVRREVGQLHSGFVAGRAASNNAARL